MTEKTEKYALHFVRDAGVKLASIIRAGRFGPLIVICDSNTIQHCLAPLTISCPPLQNAEVIELEPGEESKSIEISQHIWQILTELNAGKRALVINLGGGVVSDAGGFAASVFKRGIPYINIPTSLLAMADASVGGKTGINFAGIKNHIGAITQPLATIIDHRFLKTLPDRHIISGWAEILKIALISDRSFFKKISGDKISGAEIKPAVIKKAVELKKAVVAKDPEEKNLRKILNFGHTVGHTLESMSFSRNRPLFHGEAVAIGMAVESALCFHLKRISKSEFSEILKSLSLNFSLPPVKANEVFEQYFYQDKKHRGSSLRMALLKGIGKCDPDVEVNMEQVKTAISLYHSALNHATGI